jgi:cyanate lyase
MIQVGFQVFGDDALFDTMESGNNFGDGIVSFIDIQEQILLEIQKICQERGVKREDVVYTSPLCFPVSDFVWLERFFVVKY